MKKLKSIRQYRQLRTLYNNNGYIDEDKEEDCTETWRKGAIWKLYNLKEYNEFYHDEIDGNDGIEYKFILVNHGKWILFENEEDILDWKRVYDNKNYYNFEEIR